MAVNQAVWCVDIGMSALKALRLMYAEGSNQVLAVAFDYIEHPKILSQPDADADALIRDALKQFLSRNDVKGDLVALAVPGQAGLVRFVKLPPVEPGRMGEIVRYEARQQIPFALEEVIWDYQQMGGGGEIEGFSLDAEVGIFAMKRDQVLRQLVPLTEAGVEADLIQMTPVALYNCISYDRYSANGKAEDEEQSEKEKDFVVLLDVGADNTNLVVTDSDKVWQRNVPIGGNHFTRALTKHLKLTFAKAEHIKRNATKTKDPRAVFQAMRPVFNDFMTEVQRSIGYFASVNRNARISKIVGMGGGFKLPGLQKFLTQNLQYPVEKLSGFTTLTGDAVIAAPAFRDHVMSFAVCYGLGLQSLQLSKLRTSLLPPEIVQERLIRAKKPWILSAAAMVLLGATISFSGWLSAYKNTHEDNFKNPEDAAEALAQKAKGYKDAFNSSKTELERSLRSAKDMVATVRQRSLLPAVLARLNEITPIDPDETKSLPEREEITIPVLDCVYQKDLSSWAATVPETAKADWSDAEKGAAPKGEGFVIGLEGYHFHNDKTDFQNSYTNYVRSKLLNVIRQDQQIQQLGGSHAAIVRSQDRGSRAAATNQQGGGGRGLGGLGGSPTSRSVANQTEKPVDEFTTFRIELVVLLDAKPASAGPSSPNAQTQDAQAVGAANTTPAANSSGG